MMGGILEKEENFTIVMPLMQRNETMDLDGGALASGFR